MVEERRTVAVSPALGELLTAIDRFSRRPKDGRPPQLLALELTQLRFGCDRLELEFSETAGAFAATEEYDEQGSVSPIEWIRHHCKMTGSAAADRVNVGAQLTNLPQSAAAVADGSIGFAHLSVIARTSSALRNASHDFVETALLDSARQMSVGRLKFQAAHVRNAADPDGVEADRRNDIEMRTLRLSPMENGRVMIGGELDPEGAAAVRTALEALSAPVGPDDERHYHRRMADALIELASHALDTGGLPSVASQRPHLQVSCSLDTLRGLAGTPAGELEFSLPISAKTVQRLACDSSVVRVLLGADSAIIDVGRARRVVSPSTRRALNARDKHCQWPGCSSPRNWTEAHHITHWAHGGKTDLDNLVLLCHKHHEKVHEGGWDLLWGEDGQVLAFPTLLRNVPWARTPEYAAA